MNPDLASTPRPQDTAPLSSVGLDHVGLIVPDLEAARALWAGLGFTLTARADHTRTLPDGRRVPAGSSQHSVMLQAGYIELMQITDASAGHPLTSAMRQRFGLHILALASEDPPALHRALAARRCALSPVMDWARPVSEGAVQGLARFQFFDTPWQTEDASYLCWVRHLTPELMRPPALLRHENGALALDGLAYTGSLAGCAQWARRLAQFGLVAEAAGQIPLGEARLQLRPSRERGTDTAHTAPAARPESLQLRFADPGALATRARALGLPTTAAPDGFDIDLGQACPIRIEARRRPDA